jgi:hypothetical protein
VQAATLRVLEERVIGPLDIGPRVSFVLAGNPLGSAAGGWEFSPAMSRRFVHLIWEPSADYVITGFLQGFPPVTIPDLAAIALEDDESTAEFTRLRRPFEFDPAARGLVAGFLSAHRTAYLRVPEQGIHASHAWPNPAAWERVMLLLSAAKQAGASQQARDLLVYGSVGDGAGAEFVQYATYDDLPDAEALLADPDCFSFEQVSGDKVFVILGSVCAAVVDRNSIERWAAAWRVTARAADAYSPGQAALAARILSMNKPPGDVVAPPEVRVFMPMLRAAGLLGA